MPAAIFLVLVWCIEFGWFYRDGGSKELGQLTGLERKIDEAVKLDQWIK